MLLEVVRKWWVLLLKGICGIVFGILAFAWPGITLWSLVMLFGAYVLADGVASIVVGLGGGGGGRSWWEMILSGLLGIGAGVATFLWPGITAVVLLFIIAVWAIVRGVFEIGAAVKLRQVIEGEWLLILAGVLSIAFGVLLLLRPGAGALGVVWLIGSFALVTGIVAIALSLRLRGMKSQLEFAGRA